MFIEHDLITTRFWANLKAVMDRNQQVDWRWIPERDFRALRARVKDPKGRFWLPFLPDAMFDARYPDDTHQCSILEVDMGTLTLSRFRRKVRGFEAYLDDGAFEQRFDHDNPDVLVLTQSVPA
jgi:Replication-relaxation